MPKATKPMHPRTRISRLKKLHFMLLNHDTLFPTIFFDMGLWNARNDNKGDYNDETSKKLKESKENVCGTAACALGSAGVYKPFMKLGLKLSRPHHAGGNKIPKFEGEEGMEAGAKFFGITLDESCNLFDPENYNSGDLFSNVTIKQVARRVQSLINKYSKPQPKQKKAA